MNFVCYKWLVLFIFTLLINFILSETNLTNTVHKNDVCDIDSSCNTTTAINIATENNTEKINVTEQWKYNVSGEITGHNDTTPVDIYHLNQTFTHNPSNLEDDAINKIKLNNQTANTNETKLTNTKYQIQLNDECRCDATKGSCDINCCCDSDCLNVNRDIFQYCIEDSHIEKEDFCSTKILNSPLLCVVRDNLYSRHFYPMHQIATEVTNINKLLRNREMFGWSLPSSSFQSETEMHGLFKEYSIGSFVWIFTNTNEIKKFRLPKATLISRDCKITETVTFLNNYKETCTYRINDVSKSYCESNSSVFNAIKYFSNYSVIKNPSNLNLSSPFNCTFNCIKPVPYYCENNDITLCKKINISSMLPLFNKEDNKCQRVISHIYYQVLHNGSEGILEFNIYFQFFDLKMNQNDLWAIKFQLVYQWFNQTKFFKLSGYPGYVPMKPIIVGYKLTQSSKENRTNENIKMSNNKNHWLTVFQTDNNGYCQQKQRDNILFQENLYAHCFLKVPKINSGKSCESFQLEIFNTLFGSHLNISNAYISTLGKPDINDKRKWAPIVIDMPSVTLNETCDNIVTSVKIIILHSTVGEFDTSQQSIIGVKVTGKSSEKNVQKYNYTKIIFAVNFYDVTSPPLRIFAEPPTYEVKLPTDFFYPFFSHAPSIRISKLLIISILISFLRY